MHEHSCGAVRDRNDGADARDASELAQRKSEPFIEPLRIQRAIAADRECEVRAGAPLEAAALRIPQGELGVRLANIEHDGAAVFSHASAPLRIAMNDGE